MDLNSDIRYKVLVERMGYAFFVDLEFENLLAFCNNCNIIGHSLDKCKHRGDDNDKGKQIKRGYDGVLEEDNGKQKKAKKQIFIQVIQGSKPTDNTIIEKDHMIE